MKKVIKTLNKNNILLYTVPIFIIFFIALMAYYPGIVAHDGLVQWNYVKTGVLNDWHPAYNTFYLSMLVKIWDNPFLPIFIQCIVLSFSIGFFLSKLDKWYHVNRWYLLFCSILLAALPLTFNSAVILLKDSLFLAFVILLSAYIIEFANDKKFFDKKSNNIWLNVILLFISLTRHNGLYAAIMFDIVMFIVFRKKKKYIKTTLITIGIYLLMTTVGYAILDVDRGNVANKYGPVSHLLTRIIIENKNSISRDEYKTLSKFFDIDDAVKGFNSYDMDQVIFAQYFDTLRENQGEYLSTALKIIIRNPKIVLKHYKYLDRFLYSPFRYKDEKFIGMFIETNLWIYKDKYQYLNEDSKIEWLLPILKKYSDKCRHGLAGDIFMKPAIYMYSIFIISFVLSRKYKNKLLLFLSLFILCNTIILAVSIPVPMTRYVSSTILLGQLMLLWFIYELIKDFVTIDYSKEDVVISKEELKIVDSKKIAILIPCYNESKTIEKIIKDYKKVLPKADIYVYDNNSEDGTDKIAKKAGATVRYVYRQGKGNVIKRMFKDLDYECYLMIDGDDTYSSEDARNMCALVVNGKADMVIGDRLSSTYFKVNKRPFHDFGNRLVRFLINKLFKSNIKDILTGYRAFSYEFVKSFPITSEGFEIETEMTIHALDKKFLIKEIPVGYKNRSKGSVSKLNTYSDGFKVLRTIMRLFKEYKPMSFFGIISIVFFIISIGFGTGVFVEYFKTGLVPRFPTLIFSGFMLMISILMLVCGIILDVVVKKHKQSFQLYLLKIKNKEEV